MAWGWRDFVSFHSSEGPSIVSAVQMEERSKAPEIDKADSMGLLRVGVCSLCPMLLCFVFK